MSEKRPYATVSTYLLLGFVSLVLADLGTLYVRQQMLPNGGPSPVRTTRPYMRPSESSASPLIAKRNIFNSDQKIPDALGNDQERPEEPNAQPVLSSLPLQLVGTIVHVNPLRSVATIQLRNKSEQMPFKVNDVIPDNLALVKKIERNKVIFENKITRHLEFIEIKENAKINFGPTVFRAQQNGEVLKKSDTEFELKKNDIERLTKNLPEILQQARAVPRMGPNGQIECFNIADMQPGSIYEKLGLRRGDCIKSVNGERIDSPAKAMEAYNRLRANADSISLGVERSGRDEEFTYSITK